MVNIYKKIFACISGGYSVHLEPLFKNNKMSRNFTHRISGKFCVQINWDSGEALFNSANLTRQFEVKNWVTGRKVPAAKVTTPSINYYHKIKFNHLDAGEYQITLQDVTQKITDVDLCPGALCIILYCFIYNFKININIGGSIKKTWRRYQKYISKCHFQIIWEEPQISAWPSYIYNPKLKGMKTNPLIIR